MGWIIKLTLDKKITETVLDSVLTKPKLPRWMSSPWGENSKQNWGWSLAADVMIISAYKIQCSGSYGISGEIAESFGKVLAERLRKSGYKVKIGEMKE